MNEDIQQNEIESHFNSELELLTEALNEANELYDEVKFHYDAIKNSSGRGTLTFVQNQTSSLVSLKTMKLQIIKEQINIKKNIMDFELKKKNAEGEEDADNKVVLKVLQELNKQDSVKKDVVINEIEVEDESNFDDEFERRLKELEDEGSIEFSESEQNAINERNGANQINVDELIKSVVNSQREENEEE